MSHTEVNNSTTLLSSGINELIASPTPAAVKILKVDGAQEVFYLIILVIMAFMGVFGNTMIIAATCVVKSLRTPSNVLIVNLALADMIVAGVVNPFAIVGAIHGESWFVGWKYGLCRFLGMLCVLACGCSLLTILAISFNRYVALIHHVRYNEIFTFRNTILLATSLWVIATVLVLPLEFGWAGLRFDPKALMCLFQRSTDYSFNLVLCFVMILGPVLLIAFFYLKIFLYLRHRRNAVKQRSGPEVAQSAAAARRAKDDARLNKTLFIIFISFVLCWTPFAIVFLLDFNDQWPAEVYMWTVTIDHLSSSGINFILYGITNSQYRDGYTKMLCCCCPKSITFGRK